jgi:hypothetical protein
MMIIRGAQASTETPTVPEDDPLQEQAAEAFADDLASDRVPSIRAIRARLHIGQPRAQRLRAYLAILAET